MSVKHERHKRGVANRKARAKAGDSLGRLQELVGALGRLTDSVVETRDNINRRRAALLQPTTVQEGDEAIVEYDTPVKKDVTSSVELKYVRHSKLGFITWPANPSLWHSHIGGEMCFKTRSTEHAGAIVSAGFARIENGKVICYGKSETLGKGSLSEDSKLLAAQFGLVAAVRTT